MHLAGCAARRTDVSQEGTGYTRLTAPPAGRGSAMGRCCGARWRSCLGCGAAACATGSGPRGPTPDGRRPPRPAALLVWHRAGGRWRRRKSSGASQARVEHACMLRRPGAWDTATAAPRADPGCSAPCRPLPSSWRSRSSRGYTCQRRRRATDCSACPPVSGTVATLAPRDQYNPGSRPATAQTLSRARRPKLSHPTPLLRQPARRCSAWPTARCPSGATPLPRQPPVRAT